MPFRSLGPEDIVRAGAALEAAWSEIRSQVPEDLKSENERDLHTSWRASLLSRRTRKI